MVAPYLQLESSKKDTRFVKSPESLVNIMNILNIITYMNIFQKFIPSAINANLAEIIIVAFRSLK